MAAFCSPVGHNVLEPRRDGSALKPNHQTHSRGIAMPRAEKSVKNAQAPIEAGPETPRLRPVGRHRSPQLIGLGIATIALGGLGAAWLFTTMSGAVPVLAVQATVDRGDVIEASDLATASISLDPSLSPVSADDLELVVGQRAAHDMPAGTIVTRNALSDESVPAAGFSVVPVAVPSTRLPLQDLRPGSAVRVVDTPREGDEPPAGRVNAQSATVLDVVFDEDSGQSVVQVSVPEAVAADLAARAATGRVTLVLDSGSGQ